MYLSCMSAKYLILSIKLFITQTVNKQLNLTLNYSWVSVSSKSCFLTTFAAAAAAASCTLEAAL